MLLPLCMLVTSWVHLWERCYKTVSVFACAVLAFLCLRDSQVKSPLRLLIHLFEVFTTWKKHCKFPPYFWQSLDKGSWEFVLVSKPTLFPFSPLHIIIECHASIRPFREMHILISFSDTAEHKQFSTGSEFLVCSLKSLPSNIWKCNKNNVNYCTSNELSSLQNWQHLHANQEWPLCQILLSSSIPFFIILKGTQFFAESHFT